jgi:hypothetical protein
MNGIKLTTNSTSESKNLLQKLRISLGKKSRIRSAGRCDCIRIHNAGFERLLICVAPMLGPGTHVHVLPAGQPALARPQGGHPQGTLPEDRRHQASHAHRGQILFLLFMIELPVGAF